MDRLAVDELHGDVRMALGLRHLVHPADVLVVDAGLGLGLLEEALDVLAVVLVAQELQGDEAVQPGVPGLVHPGHPPLAEEGQDFIAVP